MKPHRLFLALALVGCAATTAPSRQYVIGENASLCFDDDAKLAELLFRAEYVREVTPLYASFSSHGSPTARVTGAAIALRNVPIGPERLENVIECHRLAVASHRGRTCDGCDPYALSDEQMRVSVEPSERGDLVVKLSCREIEDAREVLARAYAMIGRTSPIATR